MAQKHTWTTRAQINPLECWCGESLSLLHSKKLFMAEHVPSTHYVGHNSSSFLFFWLCTVIFSDSSLHRVRAGNVLVLLNGTNYTQGRNHCPLADKFIIALKEFTEHIGLIDFLQICGAAMLNLSLLTSDMWAVLIRIFAYHEKVWIYGFPSPWIHHNGHP
jgi:hypothetical protein